MALLNKMAILDAPDLKRETVAVPEWGDGAEVIVQEMTALDRDKLRQEQLAVADGNPLNLAARVLVRCLIAPDGSRLFVDEEAEALGRKSTAVLDRLFDVARRLNTIYGEAGEEIKK